MITGEINELGLSRGGAGVWEMTMVMAEEDRASLRRELYWI